MKLNEIKFLAVGMLKHNSLLHHRVFKDFSLGSSKMEENNGQVQLLVSEKNNASITITTICQTAEKAIKDCTGVSVHIFSCCPPCFA